MRLFGHSTVLAFALILSLTATGCQKPDLDRKDAKAVAETFFRAVMAKNYQRVQDVMGSGGNIPSKQAWNDGSFMTELKPGLKERWLTGPISEYTINEIALNDLTQPTSRKLVAVSAMIDGRKGGIAFSMERQENEWYPVWSQWDSIGVMGVSDFTLILCGLD